MTNLVNTLVIIGAIDLVINCFFHFIQLKRYCQHEIREGIHTLAARVDRMHGDLTQSQRDAQVELHESFQFIKRKISEEYEEDPDGERRR
jgi:hypothetical protein